MIATLKFAEHPSWVGDARIYAVDPPFKGFDHIAITVHRVEYGQWQNAGVEVVGCNAEGHIPGSTVEFIHSSYVVESHDDVLRGLGYTVAVPA